MVIFSRGCCEYAALGIRDNMKMPKIKVCGLRTRGDVLAVNGAVPDYTGFIFDPKRKRYVAPDVAEKLRQELNPFIEAVGVFVDQSVEEILWYLSKCRVRTVQLHGHETDEFIEELRLHTGGRVKMIKAFRIDGEEDVAKAEHSAADLVLLDHGIGGTGESFDWALIRDFNRPYFLAGGLTPGNVQEAIDLAHPDAVDASSGLEGADGHKNAEKVKAFVAAVRESGMMM